MRVFERWGSGLGRPWLALLVLLACLAGGPAQAEPAAGDVDARVAQAQAFTSRTLSAKVLNAAATLSWIGDGSRFWYKKATDPDHDVYFIVDAATGRQDALFDPQRMNAALAAAGGTTDGVVPRIFEASVAKDALSITVGLPKPGATCRWPMLYDRCTMPVNRYRCDLPVTSCMALPAAPAGDTLLSPDGKSLVYASANNLWLKDVATGATRQLTTAGVENFAYGRIHMQTDTLEASRRRAGLPEPLAGVLWSPDSRYLLTVRHDVRKTKLRLVLTDYVPPEGGPPIVHSKHTAAGGDDSYPEAALDIISVADRAIRNVPVDAHLFEDMALRYFDDGDVWWNMPKDEMWFVGTKRIGLDERLVHVDLRTGAAKDVIVETGKKPIRLNTSSYAKPNVAVLPGKRQFLWFSELDDWGHIYLYDLDTGRQIRQLTKGPWVFADIVYLDQDKRVLYFNAAGKEAGQNPVYLHLYKMSLDGAAPRLLTPEVADHRGKVSPNGRYIIDAYSTTTEPDRYVLRDSDGGMIAPIMQADISALVQTGWQPPEQVTAKAADGRTDLYGVIFKPHDFDPTKKYPIIEITYPGIWTKYAPTQFRDNFYGSGVMNAFAFAELGAVVVSIDGRGTGYRSASFHDAFIGTDDANGAIDHVAAIRDLAATRPWMDLDRIGVTGHSSGGDGSLRAAMLYPDFYKVVVSGEGPSDYNELSLDFAVERVLGMAGNTDAGRALYDRVATTNLVSRLTPKNKVLLIYDGADEEVPLQQGFKLFEAFQKIGFVYDELLIAGEGHWGGRSPYGVMRTMRYFAEHLGGPQ